MMRGGVGYSIKSGYNLLLAEKVQGEKASSGGRSPQRFGYLYGGPFHNALSSCANLKRRQLVMLILAPSVYRVEAL